LIPAVPTLRILSVCLLAVCLQPGRSQTMNQVKLVILDPAHFHAALIQKETYPWVSNKVSVYAPLGAELLDYLNRVALFNARPEKPTNWELEVHTAPDFMNRMLKDRAGNVVVFAGRNRGKIDRINASLDAGLNVLADKPWIISSADLPKLEAALKAAESKGLVGYDIMTERYEITSILQRELVNAPEVFGQQIEGTPEEPGIVGMSVHHIMKMVAGVPIRRSVWFFDVEEYGEGLADVGTHVVDLVQWTAFPDQPIDYRRDIRLLEGKHWPTVVTQEQFRQVTAEADFPRSVSEYVKNGRMDYYCNNSVLYTLKGIHTKLDILWNWEAPPGTGDAYEAAFRGTKARIEIRQGKAEKFIPELYVVPVGGARAEVVGGLKRKIAALQTAWPGVGIQERGGALHVVIPERFRVGHEAHFAQVTNRFFDYLKSPRSMPEWEKPNMLAKYYVSTKGTELGRERARSGAR
jgi:predicted dehydrogenase